MIGSKLESEVCGKYIMMVGCIFNIFEECKFLFLDVKEFIELYNFIIIENIENRIVWYYDIELKNDIWYFIEIEEKLMLLVNLGKFFEIKELLNLLYYKNFVDNNLLLSMKYVLIIELIGIIVKIVKRLKLNIDNLCDVKRFYFVIGKKSIDELFDDIR